MADWKNLLKNVLLADGIIDADETLLIEKEVMADAIVDDDEINFLVDLRNSADKTSQEYETFFFSALTKNILADGVIDKEETVKLREILFADGIIDEGEKELLRTLKKDAREYCTEFEELFRECIG